MTVKPQEMASEMFERTMEACNTALKMGVKWQEETAQWWTEMLGGAGTMKDWQKRAQKMAEEAIPTARRNADEYIKAADQSYKNGLDLLKQLFETGQTQSIADLEEKTRALWEASFGAIRTNAQALVRANTQMMESWAEFVRKSVDTNGRGGKGASA